MMDAGWRVLMVTALGACDSELGPSSSPRGPDGGRVTLDAAMLGSDPDAGMSAGDAGGADAGSKTDAGSDPFADRRLFVPDLPLRYVGTIAEPGMEVTAFTLYEDPVLHDLSFLVRIENVFALTICALEGRFHMVTAAGTTLDTARGLVSTPLHRGVSGRGDLVRACLGPGQMGMFEARLLDLEPEDAPTIAEVTWEVYGLNLTDAVPNAEFPVLDVMAVTDARGRRNWLGRVQNNSSASVRNPSVDMFGLNSVGRPLFHASDIEITTIAARGSWSFETSPAFEHGYVAYEAFPDVSDF